MNRIVSSFYLILTAALLAACAGGQAPVPLVDREQGGSGPATPTLAGALHSQPPTPPVTPWMPLPNQPAAPGVPAPSGPGEGALATAGPSPTPSLSPTPAATATPSATATPAATPTATPRPEERLALAQAHLHNENFAAAREQYQAVLNMTDIYTPLERQEALFGLGRAYLGDGRYTSALEYFDEFLALNAAGLQPPQDEGPQPGAAITPSAAAVAAAAVDTYFYLAQAYENSGDCRSAAGAYEAYLSLNEDMAAYVAPRLARCYLRLDDGASALAAYESAAAAPAHSLVALENRLQLAQLYLQEGRYAAAVAQYDAILQFAVTENTRGQATYLAGQAEILAGNEEAGYARYLTAFRQFPRARESHQALVALLDAGHQVDDFQRGLVNYHARSFTPAVTAFTRYLQENPANHREDVHLFLAWSYEGLGNVTAAVQELDTYIEAHPDEPELRAQGWWEKARLQARAGQQTAAVATYRRLVELFPNYSEAPAAAWLAANLTERAGDAGAAATLYRQMAAAYPRHNDAPRALFRAALLTERSGDRVTAVSTWQEVLERYPNHEYAAAAVIWLIRVLPEAEAAPYLAQAQSRRGVSYYHLRAYDLAHGVPIFQPPPAVNLDANEAAEQAATEAWLRNWLALEPGTPVAPLSARLRDDPRLIRGEKLWRLGLYNEAKGELEAVRSEHSQNALLSYQLALYFRDLGLYRSSIVAAAAVMQMARVSPFQAPRQIARLAYPVYYGDVIVPLAEAYGYDPLLQFALVRQESLFESFAVSHAAAQGLSQVIPDTGLYIAQRLNWPDYENALLYRPYVGLAFGAYYLQQQLAAFDGDVYAALAAYNAGPGNARRWYNVAAHDPDLYVETVNFAETRLYIERIYAGHAIYRHLYGATGE
jgi:soluble lytic murein transglycosylase